MQDETRSQGSPATRLWSLARLSKGATLSITQVNIGCYTVGAWKQDTLGLGQPRTRRNRRDSPSSGAVHLDNPVIVVRNFSKSYGSLQAVTDVSFEVARGSVFGLVGPNGAGKSTLIESIEGLRTPSAGTIEVLGQPQNGRDRSIFKRVGVALQQNEVLPRLLRTGEIIDLFRTFYNDPLSTEEILDICGLAAQRHVMSRKLSGGQRRRLAVALALAGKPDLIILDEPTSGLDPQARFTLWQALRQYKRSGGTVLLSTHYMEEAEEECDDLCLLDHGRIQVQGNPTELMTSRGMRVLIKVPARPPVTWKTLHALPSVQQLEQVEDLWHVYGASDQIYVDVKALAGLEFLEMRPARLEDLYLMTTGRSYRSAS